MDEHILKTLQANTEGLTVSELSAQLPELSRRSLQRYLSDHVSQGKITKLREGRAFRYFASTTAYDNTTSIALSADSRDILAYINQPISLRTPVPYQQDFLDSYQPNHSFYLSESLRRQLHKMGQTKAHSRPAGTYGRHLLNRLLIDLSWASSHLEGNTYSRLDTQLLIEEGQAAAGKALTETQMILNHKAAIELLLENAEIIGFDRYTLLNLHSSLSENLLPNPADEGRLRQHTVEIFQSAFRPLDVPPLIETTFNHILTKAEAISDPFEQAFFIMVHLPYLQPFADVNKRMSRLAANIPLIKHNLCPLTFLGVPETLYVKAILGVYEMTRVELLRDVFVWAYERSTQEYNALKQNLVEPDPLRLQYRELIKTAVRDVILEMKPDTVGHIQAIVSKQVTEHSDIPNVQALIIDEIRRLHEGVLARYRLRPSEWQQWEESHKR